MSSLIPEACGRPGDDPIFTINAVANQRKAQGEVVINASLGALIDDDGRLATMPSVFEALRAVDPRQAAAYAPIAGDLPYLDAVRRDAFGEGTLGQRTVAAATAGGTGAIHHAIVNFLEPGQALYTSSYFWSPYGIIAHHTHRSVETFPMFDADGAFDVAAFTDGLCAQVKRQGRALVILNFPCHNPTGYSLDKEEWEGIAAGLARAAESGPVVLLLDLAYAHYVAGGNDRDRMIWSRALEPIADRVTILAAWTASKSFAQYGARIGALVASVADDAERVDVANALSYSCRGTWSNCNHLGLLAVASILGDDERRARVDAERQEHVALLDSRVAVFNTVAQGAGLTYPRYEGGFFVAVFTPDAKRTAQLCADEGVFVVPLQNAVRLALCSTPAADIPRLVESVARGVAAAHAGQSSGCT